MKTVDLQHRFLGGEGNPPLVILHGLLGSSRNWKVAGAGLTPAFAVYVLDQRNHGDSPHAETHTYGDLVEDLRVWLDRHELERVALMGHSMGGKASMRFACRYPERVEQLYIADISPRHYHPRYDRYLEAMQGIPLEELADRRGAEMHLEPAVEDKAMRQFLLTNLVRDPVSRRFRWMVNIPVLLREMPELIGNPLASDDRFEGPTLFLKGAQSTFIEEEDRALIRRHFPRAHFVVLKGAGHNLHVEDKDTFVTAVVKAQEYFRKA